MKSINTNQLNSGLNPKQEGGQTSPSFSMGTNPQMKTLSLQNGSLAQGQNNSSLAQGQNNGASVPVQNMQTSQNRFTEAPSTPQRDEQMPQLSKPKLPQFTSQPSNTPLIPKEEIDALATELNTPIKPKIEKREKPIQNKPEVKKPSKKPSTSDDNVEIRDNLTPTEFYCIHFKLIKETIDKVLRPKYPVVEAILNKETRNEIEAVAGEEVKDFLTMKQIPGLNYTFMPEYIKLVFAEAMGFGILEFLLNDKEVDEVIVEDHEHICVERHGVLELTDYKFPSFDAAYGIIKRIIMPLNKSLDVSNPNVDGQLPDGSRVSASIPPLRAENQISIDIRKFSEKVEPLMKYCEKYQSSTPEMVKFIEACVNARKTLIVSGGTGSGKTTLLNSMTFAINPKERILVIEDTREIKVQVPRVEYYLKVGANNEGYKGISIGEIIQHSLRKRPDRIIVGECRGGEFNEYLNAANTGHDGSVTSIHSNSPQALFQRMEQMLLKNEETKNMTHEAIMRTLSSSVDIIVQTKRLADGTRKITNVTEVLGYGKDGFDKLRKMGLTKKDEVFDPYKVYMKDIFYFKEIETEETLDDEGNKKVKVRGQFISTGYVPFCNRELKRKGVGFGKEFFENRTLLEV